MSGSQNQNSRVVALRRVLGQSPELGLGIHWACHLASAQGGGTQARLCRCPARARVSPAPRHLGLAHCFPLRVLPPAPSALAPSCPVPSSRLGVPADVPSVAVLGTLASWILVSFFCPTRRNSRRDLNKPHGAEPCTSGGRNAGNKTVGKSEIIGFRNTCILCKSEIRGVFVESHYV